MYPGHGNKTIQHRVSQPNLLTFSMIRHWQSDLSENWKLDVNYMGQETSTNGVWDHNPDELGEYNVSRFYDDKTHDEWTRFSATVTGDLGFADLTFTTSSLERDFEVLSDYSHYSIDGYVEGPLL